MFVIRLSLLYIVYYCHCYGRLDLDIYRHFCPYTKFCTNKSSVVDDFFFSEDEVPCCFPCYCDPQCWIFSDCCPDAERPDDIFVKNTATCQHAHYMSEHLRAGGRRRSIAAKYIIQDKCPFNSTGPIADKCAEIFDDIPSLDDISVVSDSSHLSRVYKNKYCAECHGVKNVTRWNARTGLCQETQLFSDRNITHSNVWERLLDRCQIQSLPTPEIPTRSIACSDVMPYTGCEQGTKYMDLDVYEACLNSPGPMYYQLSSPKNFQHFNLFCYVCISNASGPVKDVCDISVFDAGQRHVSMVVMLDLRPEDLMTSESGLDVKDPSGRCNVQELYDGLNNVCRRLLCAWYAPLNGSKCVPVGKIVPGSAIEYNMIFIFKPPINFTIDFISKEELNQLERVIRLRSKLSSCSFAFLKVHGLNEHPSNYTTCISVYVTVRVMHKCSFNNLNQKLSETAAKLWYQRMKIGNQTIDTVAKIMFYPSYFDIFRDLVEGFSEVLLFTGGFEFDSRAKIFLDIVQCAHVLLRIAEYNEIMEKTNNNINTTKEITIKTLLYEGFYATGKDEIAVCSDTFLDLVNGVDAKLKTGVLIIVLYCYIVI